MLSGQQSLYVSYEVRNIYLYVKDEKAALMLSFKQTKIPPTKMFCDHYYHYKTTAYIIISGVAIGNIS